MNLNKDSFHKIIINEDFYYETKINCFYFSYYYYNDLCYLVNYNYKYIHLLSNQIMTHIYLRHLLKNDASIYQILCNSKFNIKIRPVIFKVIKDKCKLRRHNEPYIWELWWNIIINKISSVNIIEC